MMLVSKLIYVSKRDHWWRIHELLNRIVIGLGNGLLPVSLQATS